MTWFFCSTLYREGGRRRPWDTSRLRSPYRIIIWCPSSAALPSHHLCVWRSSSICICLRRHRSASPWRRTYRRISAHHCPLFSHWRSLGFRLEPNTDRIVLEWRRRRWPVLVSRAFWAVQGLQIAGPSSWDWFWGWADWRWRTWGAGGGNAYQSIAYARVVPSPIIVSSRYARVRIGRREWPSREDRRSRADSSVFPSWWRLKRSHSWRGCIAWWWGSCQPPTSFRSGQFPPASTRRNSSGNLSSWTCGSTSCWIGCPSVWSAASWEREERSPTIPCSESTSCVLLDQWWRVLHANTF